jgi:hypothetical protein
MGVSSSTYKTSRINKISKEMFLPYEAEYKCGE